MIEDDEADVRSKFADLPLAGKGGRNEVSLVCSFSNNPSALTHSEGAGRRESLSKMTSAVLVQTKGLA